MPLYGADRESFDSTVEKFKAQTAQRERLLAKEKQVEAATAQTRATQTNLRRAVDETTRARQGEAEVVQRGAKDARATIDNLKAETIARRELGNALRAQVAEAARLLPLRGEAAARAAGQVPTDATRVRSAVASLGGGGQPQDQVSKAARAVREASVASELPAAAKEAADSVHEASVHLTDLSTLQLETSERLRQSAEGVREKVVAAERAAQRATLGPGVAGGGRKPPTAGPRAVAFAEPPEGGRAQPERILGAVSAGERGVQNAIANARAVETQAAAVRNLTSAYGPLDTSMRRHGALTAEFIAQAARGETTIRELGWQVGVTTAKFAGWTLAATAVFSLFSALRKLTSGAAETNNQLQQLERFIPNLDRARAAQQLQQQSVALNVPISDVGDAASHFARLYKDQNDVFTAAHTAMLATKLDNIDAADSYRYLIATVEGFKLSAKDLPGLLDSVNASQRDFGTQVKELLPAIARAAGGWTVAGGSLQHLQATVATIQRVTGQSGSSIGTGLSRAATRFVHMPTNVAELAKYGINASPNRTIDQIIDQAMQQIQQRNLGRNAIRNIAQAVGGPQYGARFFTALFENTRLYHRILNNTTPEKNKGTAEHELQKVLASVGEEAKSVGVAIEAMGSKLGQSGLLTPVQALLRGMSGALHVGSSLIGVFDGMGKSLRTAALAAAALYASVRLARHFNIAPRIASVPGLGFFDNPQAALKRQTLKGLGTQQDVATKSADRLASAAVERQIEAEGAARARQIYVESEEYKASQKLATDAEGRVAANEKLAELDRRQLQTAIRSAATEQEIEAAKQIRLRAERERAEAAATPARAFPAWAAANIPGAVPAMSKEELDRAAAEAALTPRGTRVRDEFSRRGFTRMGESLGSGVSNLERRAGRIGSFATRLSAARVGSTLKGIGSSFSRIGTELAESTGPLDVVIAAVVAFGFIKNTVDSDQAKLAAALDKAKLRPGDTAQSILSRSPDKHGGLGGLVNSYVDAYDKVNNFFADTLHEGDIASALNRVPVVGGALSFLPAHVFGGQHMKSPDELLRERERQQGAEADAINTLQAHQRARGLPVWDQKRPDILKSAQQDVEDYKHGRIGLKELQADFQKHLVELQHDFAHYQNPNAPMKGRQALAALAAGATTDVKTFRESLAHMGLTRLSSLTAGSLQDLQQYGLGSGLGEATALAPRRALSLEYARMAALARNAPPGKKGDKTRQAFFQFDQDITSQLQSQVQDDLQISLTLATSQKDRDRAYAEAIRASSAGRAPNVQGQRRIVNSLQEAVAKRRNELAAARRRLTEGRDRNSALAGVTGGGAFRTFALGDLGVLSQSPLDKMKQHAQANVDALEAGVKANQKVLKSKLDDLKKARAKLRLITRAQDAFNQQMRTQRVQEHEDTIAAQGDLALSQINPENTQAIDRKTLDNAEKIRDYMMDHRRVFNVRDIKRAVTEVNNARWQLANDARQNAQDISDLQFDIQSTRQEGDPVAQARTAIAKARSHIAHARNEKERLQGIQELADANNQLEQAARDQVSARYELLESLTTDPLKIDRYKIHADRRALSFTKKGSSDYKTALAQVNNDLKSYRDDKVSQRESQIEYEVTIGRITNAESLKDYENLKKMRHLSKQNRQDINERIVSARQATVSDKEADIDFRLQMNQISRDQAIGMYENMLRTMKLSRDMRRDIKLKIHDLKQESDQDASGFDLDVGSIKFPTVLDVRRAYAPLGDLVKQSRHTAQALRGQHGNAILGRDTASSTVVTNNISVTITKDADSGKVIATLDRAVRGRLKSKMRTAGQR